MSFDRLASLLLLLTLPAALLGAEPIYREQLDDPPAPIRARDDLFARTARMTVSEGPYVSRQVNIDLLGLNIVGDAANEPSIAVNPTDHDNLVIGWRQFDSIASNFRQGGWAYSFDGGASWSFPGVLTPGTFRSDPVLDFDSQGRLFYQSLQQSFDLDVFTSFDGGQSFGPPVFAFGGDKNWMVVDRSGGLGHGNIYGIWQAAVGCCGQQHFNRSEDAAQSFEAPVATSGSPGLGTMAVGPDGTVYAAGIDETTGQNTNVFVVTRSLDAQDPGSDPSFSSSVVNLGGSLGFSTGPNPQGLIGQVNVAVDRSFGPLHGNVYVMASLRPNGGGSGADVFFARSENGGQTWSSAIRVNDDPPNAGNWQWLAAMSVAANGRIDAMWADTRDGGSVNVSRLYYSYSWDGGVSWSPNVAASPAFDSSLGWPQQNKMGDYYTMVSDLIGSDAAYTATFNGEQDVYHVRLFPDCNGNAVSDVLDLATGSFDCNANHVPDECEGGGDCGFAGRTPDGRSVDGQPLVLGRERNGDGIVLEWGASCLAADDDYAVYQGILGEFSNYTPRVCSTGGATSLAIAADEEDRFFIVVPRGSAREGSYGSDSQLQPRPPSADACLQQSVAFCLGLPELGR